MPKLENESPWGKRKTVVPSQDEIVIHSQDGECVIRQSHDLADEDCIFVQKANVPALIRALEEWLKTN